MIWETPNVLTLPTSIHYIFFQMFFCCCLLCRKAKNIRTLKSKNLSDTILTNYVPVSLFKYAPPQWCTVNWVKYTFRAASCKKSLRKNKSIRKNKSTRKHILYLKMCFLILLSCWSVQRQNEIYICTETWEVSSELFGILIQLLLGSQTPDVYSISLGGMIIPSFIFCWIWKSFI